MHAASLGELFLLIKEPWSMVPASKHGALDFRAAWTVHSLSLRHAHPAHVPPPPPPPLQTRLILPSWLGVDTAITRALEEGYGPTLQAMYREWPFFSSTVDLIEMILAKVRPCHTCSATLARQRQVEANLRLPGSAFAWPPPCFLSLHANTRFLQNFPGASR